MDLPFRWNMSNFECSFKLNEFFFSCFDGDEPSPLDSMSFSISSLPRSFLFLSALVL